MVVSISLEEKMNTIIREIRAEEYPLLNEFLYYAIFVPEGQLPPPKMILEKDELQVYVQDFGNGHADIGLVAEAGGEVIGAVWVRDMHDYGHVEDGVPSFAISILPEWRGRGVGSALMRRMLDKLRERGFDRASLAVQKANYALKMYRSIGFEIVDENDEEYIMICKLNSIK